MTSLFLFCARVLTDLMLLIDHRATCVSLITFIDFVTLKGLCLNVLYSYENEVKLTLFFFVCTLLHSENKAFRKRE